MHLVEEPSVVDPTYIEDFLLTYRTFLSSPMEVGKKLLEWLQRDNLQDTVSPFAYSAPQDKKSATFLLSGIFYEYKIVQMLLILHLFSDGHCAAISTPYLLMHIDVNHVFCPSHDDQYRCSKLSCP